MGGGLGGGWEGKKSEFVGDNDMYVLSGWRRLLWRW